MTDSAPQPPSETADALTVAQRDLGEAHADLHQVQSVILREGPRSKKTARYVAVKNRHTGAVHHHALTLETGKKLKGTWELDDKRSISFSDEEGDEIAKLMDFLRHVRGGAAPAATADPLDVPGLLRAMSEDVEGLRVLVRTVREHPEAFKRSAAAITFGRHAQGLERLKKLLAVGGDEAELRALVEGQLWLLGLEYGEAVPAEELEDEALLYRTPAGRLELVMARRPVPGAALFVGDAPGADLAQALGDAMRLRDIAAPAGEVTVRLLVGLEADEEVEAALRRLNAHLSGIEALTYDQLIARGQRVLDVLRATAKGEG